MVPAFDGSRCVEWVRAWGLTPDLGAIKKARFTEEQIAYALRQAERGTAVADVCRQLGVSETTFYVWKRKFAHLGTNEMRRRRKLE